MPEFDPLEERVAIATFPVSPAGLGCSAELWLASNGEKVATSGEMSFLSTGEAQSISLPITMPESTGAYPVFLDISASGILIAAYQSSEDVVIKIPTFPDPQINYTYIRYWTAGSVLADNLVNSKHTLTLVLASYISASYELEVVLMKNGEVRASGSFSGYFQDSHASYQGIRIDNFVLPSEPGEYDVLLRTYRSGQLTGIYDEGKLDVLPITEPSDLDFQNLSYSLFSIPPVIWHYLDVECDIVNTGSQTITRTVALWYHLSPLGAKYGNYWKVAEKHFGHGTNDGRVTLTLAPGASFHYHFTGGNLMRGLICIELRDNMGGISEYPCASW